MLVVFWFSLVIVRFFVCRMVCLVVCLFFVVCYLVVGACCCLRVVGLFRDWLLLFVVRCVLVVACSFVVVCCLLVVGCCLLVAVRCSWLLLFSGCGLLCVVS